MSDYKGLDAVLASHALHERSLLLDDLFATLHNDGADLSLNTEANDLAWFGYWLYVNYANLRGGRAAWERLDESERQDWMTLAKFCIDALPMLLGRIAHRYEVAESALKVLADSERKKWYQTDANLRKLVHGKQEDE